ncbi:MAG: hypothetical protein H7Z40_16300 [Phycisphaerae bacterium]|nr:hypothetical protein [Gemmatimonadaceae bacterium]
MSRTARLLLLASIALVCSAHIGSPDAWYNGPAGPYTVLVHVKAPAVVPGIAEISVKPEGAVDAVSAFVNKFDAVEGGPPPDVARPVADNPGWYRTQLWVMDPGSNSVTVSLRGAKGVGLVVVPLVAVAARRLQFNGVLSALLVAAALVLVAGLLTLVGAAVREAVLPPGATPDAVRKQRARFAMVRGAVVIVLAVGGLGFWWGAEDTIFAQGLFKPLAVTARTEFVDGVGTRLVFTITDSAWTQRNAARRVRARGGTEFTSLIDDHQKLMHMFVIAENGQAHFAHLHPTTSDSVTFTSMLPPLPAGRYRVFADVLHATGFTQTLTAGLTLEVPRVLDDARLTDADDAWIAGAPAENNTTATLGDGGTATWLGAGAKVVAGAEARLRFSITPAVGDTAQLEDYLGMLGHAAVVRDDGAVFIHLHPMGTISTGAQAVLSREPAHTMSQSHEMQGDTVPDSPVRHSETLYFPYAFPQPGNYTVWVQVKRRGAVQTCAFQVQVAAANGESRP